MVEELGETNRTWNRIQCWPHQCAKGQFRVFVLVFVSVQQKVIRIQIYKYLVNKYHAKEIYHDNYKSINKASFLSSNPEGIVEPYIGSVG